MQPRVDSFDYLQGAGTPYPASHRRKKGSMSDLQVIDASPEQRADIERLQDALGAPDCRAAEIRFGLLVHPDGTNLPLPEPLFRVLMSAANSLQAGYQVIVAPVHHKLTVGKWKLARWRILAQDEMVPGRGEFGPCR